MRHLDLDDDTAIAAIPTPDEAHHVTHLDDGDGDDEAWPRWP